MEVKTPDHYEWIGNLYCETTYKQFAWESDECPHCGEVL